MSFKSIEERLVQKSKISNDFVDRMRNFDARTWITARRELKTLPLDIQKEIINTWNNDYPKRGGRMDAVRFASFITEVKRDPFMFERERTFLKLGKNYWVKSIKLSAFINTNIRVLKSFIKKLEARYEVNALRYTCGNDCLQVIFYNQDEVNTVMSDKKFIQTQFLNYLKDIGYEITDEVFFFNAYVDNRVKPNKTLKHFYNPIEKIQPRLAI